MEHQNKSAQTLNVSPVEVKRTVSQKKIMTKEQARELRDKQQRVCSTERYTAARKAIPKPKREKMVQLERRRTQELEFLTLLGDDKSVREQSGLFNTMASTYSAVMNTTKDISEASMAFGATSTKIGDAAATFSGLLKVFQQKIEEFTVFLKGLYGGLLWGIPLAIFLYMIHNRLGGSAAWGALTAPIFAVCLGDLWCKVSQYFSPVKEQGISDFSALIVTVVLSCIIPTGSNATMCEAILRRAGNFDRSVSGFTSVFEYAMKYGEVVINHVLSYFTEARVSFVDTSQRLLGLWVKRVDEFELACLSGNPSFDALRSAVQLQVDGIGFRNVLRTPHALTLCNRYVEKLGLLLQAHRGALSAATSYRQAPIMALFGGPSGAGKTTLLKMFGTAVLIKSGEVEPKDAIVNLWQKGTTEYWNGYIGQKCLILDDAFQIKNPDSMSDSEYMMMIRAVGNWAYPLNFADVESKGRFYFNSTLILGTTNVRNISNLADTVVNCPDAVTRRIEYGYWLEPAADYTKDGKLDYAKISSEFMRRRQEAQPETDPLDVFPWEAWVLKRHAFDSEPQNGAPIMPLRELVETVALELQSRRALHLEDTKELEEWFKMFKPREQSGISLDEAKQVGDKFVECDSEIEPAPPLSLRDWVLDLDTTKPSLVAEGDPKTVFEEADTTWRKWVVDSCVSIARNVAAWFERSGALLVGAKDLVAKLLAFAKNCDMESAGSAARAVLNVTAVVRCFSALGLTAFILSACAAVSAIIVAVAKSAWGLMKTLYASIFGASSIGKGHKRYGKAKEESNVKDQEASQKRDAIQFKRLPLTEQIGPNPDDVPQSRIYQNTWKMFLSDAELDVSTPMVGQIQCIEGTVVAMPEHFRRHLRERSMDHEILQFRHPTHQDFHFRMTVGQFCALKGVKVPDMDLEFVNMGLKTLKARKSILPFMLTASQMTTFLRAQGQKVELSVARPVYAKKLHLTEKSMSSPSCKLVKGLILAGKEVEQVVEYEVSTQEGDCGAPLVISENRHYGGACYVGLHIAGNTSGLRRKGYASLITKEMALDAIKHLGAHREELEEDLASRGIELVECSLEEQSGVMASGLVSGSFMLLGKVDKPLSMSTKSGIQRSVIQEDQVFGPSPGAPAVLYPKRMEDGTVKIPMVEGLRAYQSPLEFREPAMLDAAVNMAMTPHRKATRHMSRVIFTPEEAVLGIEGLKIKKMARDTSAGYPYRLSGKPGKTEFFGKGADYSLESDEWFELKNRVEYVVSKAKANVRLAHICTDFLKDEVRPLHKVEAVATRVISGSPLDYAIAVRMYFGAFLASMFASSVESGMAPGINHYTEWHMLASGLQSKGDRVFAGDFSRFDSSEQPYLHCKILEYINSWYADGEDWSKEDDVVRGILWLDLIHSRHLSGTTHKLEYVVQWHKSLPSGHPLTTPVNSMYSLISLALCYIHATGDATDMWEHVFINTFGDDNVVNPSDAVSDVFNQVTTSRLMDSLLGLVYTSDKKGAELVPYESLDEITFLKRTFRKDLDIGSGGWVGPLLKESFLQIPYWFRNRRDVGGDLERNVKLMLGELCLHDAETWDEYYGALHRWAVARDLTDLIGLKTRGAARDWVSTRTEVWF